jgi:indolepyruvate decarboxylase
MGGDGVRVEDGVGLDAALERAWATRGRFQLLDVRLAARECSPTLKRFVGAVRRLSGGSA